MLEKGEKEKGYPSLNGMENNYNLVRVYFEPNLDKKLSTICKVIGP